MEFKEAKADPNYKGSPLKKAPERSELKDCHYWIVGGQHTIMAYKMLMADMKLPADSRTDCKCIDAIVFWAPYDIDGHLKMMALSKSLNNQNSTLLDETQFLIVAQQVRSVWKEWGCPRSDSANNKDSKWKVSTNQWFVVFAFAYPFTSTDVECVDYKPVVRGVTIQNSLDANVFV
jgi:hypothetical protein